MVRRKIYDGFTFYKEFELLEWRLKMLYDIVDYFIIVESDRTFQNKPKPFYFAENKERFSQYADKIRYIQVTDKIECKDNWSIQIFQRNCISRGLTDCQPDDIVMIGDIDEFPDPEVLKKIQEDKVDVRTWRTFGYVAERSGINGVSRNLRCFIRSLMIGAEQDSIQKFLEKSPVVSEQRMFEFYVNYECASHWCGTIITLYKNMLEPQRLRDLRNKLPMIENGWHFSSMGGAKAVLNKIKSISGGVNNPVLKLPPKEQEDFVKEQLAEGLIWWRNEKLNRHSIDTMNVPQIQWLADRYGIMVGEYEKRLEESK
ncbi:putative glycosyl transferase family 17 protein [Selenomonas ruminantium subsp. lactilytica TAM6421]|uniref:Putative glycosyl transferase family 17 protein n=1 Tax=Selenomonas ruminantium subsp. lactilytica (strain NBRC 103574 / TAM6421) TaxID=927704 RepID=I0GUB9_SELRL|nr:beta-1,4-N-acetylgalactosaminyltransferase [Selenomonas ruminantium]BAL84356.1 putative glycosyl transferase family 17 protein [Selenomonas ruminantium subsp. lactilytica TAM6421]